MNAECSMACWLLVKQSWGGLSHRKAFINRSIHPASKSTSLHLPAASQIRGSGSTTKCPLITAGEILPSRMQLLCLLPVCVCVCEYTQSTAPVGPAAASTTRIPCNLDLIHGALPSRRRGQGVWTRSLGNNRKISHK